jgi:hypothetical protein
VVAASGKPSTDIDEALEVATRVETGLLDCTHIIARTVEHERVGQRRERDTGDRGGGELTRSPQNRTERTSDAS